MTRTLILLALAAACFTGCNRAQVANPLPADMLGPDPEKQLDFWHTLAERPVTSNNEAFHGLLLYVDQKDDSPSYEQRVSTLKSRKMIPADFNEPANTAVSRGTLAVAVCRILDVKGGLMMRASNSHPRYAVRELVFMDLYPTSSPHQTFSGAEFLGIIGRLEDHQRGNPANAPAAVLPGEMNQGATPDPRP